MKRFWSILAVLFILSPLGVSAADTLSISQEIHITGIVPPMRNIVINGQGDITEITSNTTENVKPVVYKGSIVSGTELPLTPALAKDYANKIKGKDLQSIDMHFSPPVQQAIKSPQPGLLATLSRVSLLSLFGLFGGN